MTGVPADEQNRPAEYSPARFRHNRPVKRSSARFRRTRPAERSPARFRVSLSIASIGAVFYGISMFSIARGDLTTALAVASNVEFIPTIAAMLIRIAPFVTLPFVLYLVTEFLTDEDADTEDHSTVLLFMASLIAIVIAIAISGIPMLVITAGAFGLNVVHYLGKKNNWRRLRIGKALTLQTYPFFIGSAFFTAIVLGPAWLPSQTAIVQGKPVLISVVKETDEFLYYLDHKTSRIIYAKPGDVTERSFCSSTSFSGMEPIASLVQRHVRAGRVPRMPSHCDTVSKAGLPGLRETTAGGPCCWALEAHRGRNGTETPCRHRSA